VNVSPNPALAKIAALRPPDPWRLALTETQNQARQLAELQRAPTPEEVAALVRAASGAAPAREKPEAPNLTAACMAMPGRFLSVPTGIRGLDVATRGGIRSGTLTIVGGAPGGHKTSLSARLAYLWARDGVDAATGHEDVLVSIVAADETRGGLLSRIGQIEHVDRDRLDSEDLSVSRPAWAVVATRLEAVKERFVIWDPREEPCTVESAGEELAKREAPTRRRVLVIDSVQARDGWACDAEGDDSPRSRIDRRVAVAGRIARTHGLAVLLVSELSRAGYRSRESSNEVNPLATLKESGGLEYAADQVLILSRVEGDAAQIDLLVAKTRWGSTGESVRLRRSGWFSYSEEQATGGRAQPARDKGADADSAVLAWIKASPGSPLRDIRGCKTELRAEAIARLLEAGLIRTTEGRNGGLNYWPAVPSSEAP
jgi:KaiC/GvpD/RAD55 family RecA-like ATPase